MSAERGKHIIAAAKSLKGKAISDQNIANFLYAASYAGRAGLFASALRHAGKISFDRGLVLAGTEGFDRMTLRDRLLPWLEASNLGQVQRLANKSIAAIISLVLTYDSLLEAVSDLYDASDPTPEDRGCVQALALVSALPMPQSEVVHASTTRI